MKFICPHCKNECTVADQLLGADVTCPHCSNVFNATALAPSKPKSAWTGLSPALGGILLLIIFILRYVSSHDLHSLIPATFKQVTVHGTVFFVNKAGDTKKASSCELIFYNEEVLRKVASEINATVAEPKFEAATSHIRTALPQLQKQVEQFNSLKSDLALAWHKYRAWSSDDPKSPEAATLLREYNAKLALYNQFMALHPDAQQTEQAVKAIETQLSQLEANFRATVNQKVRECPRIVTTTGADGNYSVTLPCAGTYATFALVSKLNNGQNEKYFVLARTTFKSFGDYTVDISNDAIADTAFTLREPDLEEFEFHFFEELALVKVMSRHYGLKELTMK